MDNELNRQKHIKNMTDNLPMLRTRLGMTQEELADKIGVSRSTVISIENKKRDMTWNTFLSLMLLFTKNEATNILLNVLDIYTEEFNEFIKDR
jgi:DNA-binding XRE family transcriptional regulator